MKTKTFANTFEQPNPRRSPDDRTHSALMKLAILPACMLLGGCSTLLTIHSGEPYSGVKCDIAGMQKTFDTSSPYYILPHCAEGLFSVVDLPFSLVGDTVVLPYNLLQRQKPHGVEAPGFSGSERIDRIPKRAALDPH